MPAPDFSAHVDPDDLAKLDLGLPRSPKLPAGRAEAQHGARDERQAARRQSGRDHAGRAAGARSSRSYAFRRS